jgi:hypothetical protein
MKKRLNVTVFEGANCCTVIDELASLAGRVNGGVELDLFDFASYFKVRSMQYPASYRGIGYTLTEHKLNIFKDGEKTDERPHPVPTSLLIIEAVDVFELEKN